VKGKVNILNYLNYLSSFSSLTKASGEMAVINEF
jgi:hypothetical protein